MRNPIREHLQRRRARREVRAELARHDARWGMSRDLERDPLGEIYRIVQHAARLTDDDVDEPARRNLRVFLASHEADLESLDNWLACLDTLVTYVGLLPGRGHLIGFDEARRTRTGLQASHHRYLRELLNAGGRAGRHRLELLVGLRGRQLDRVEAVLTSREMIELTQRGRVLTSRGEGTAWAVRLDGWTAAGG